MAGLAAELAELQKAWAEGHDVREAIKERLFAARWAGTHDTVALTALMAPLLSTSPWLSPYASGFPQNALPALMAAGGSAWLGWRLLEPWRRAQVFPSPLKLRSSEPPPIPMKDLSVEGLLMGYTVDTGKPIYVDYEQITRHLFILGQSGVGKTVAASSLMYQQMQGGGGCLFINGKADYGAREQFWQMARYCGREADVLWIVPDTPEISNSYNPVLHGDADEKADGLLMLIPSTDSNPGADHFKQEAKQALTTLIAALQRAKMAYNMIDLTVLLMSSKALEELERRLQIREPGSEESKNFSLFLDKFRKAPTEKNPQGGIDVDRMKTTFGGIGGRLYTFGTGSFGQVMNTYDPDVVLHEAILANKLVYVDLPTMGKDTTARNFGRLVIADLRSAIAKVQRMPTMMLPSPPFMVFCDEAGSYVNDSWSRIPEQARSARIFFVPAAQTAANFKAISDELFEMVIGNAWCKLYFKLGTQETAEEAANLIGMKTGVAKSMTHTQSSSASLALLRSAPEASLGDGVGLATLEREEEQYIVSPDDLKRLQIGECVMTMGGDNVFHLKIPRLTLTRDALQRIGPSRVYRWRKGSLKVNGNIVEPAGFFANVEKYLTNSALSSATRRAEEEDAQDLASSKRKAEKARARPARSSADEGEDAEVYDDA